MKLLKTCADSFSASDLVILKKMCQAYGVLGKLNFNPLLIKRQLISLKGACLAYIKNKSAYVKDIADLRRRIGPCPIAGRLKMFMNTEPKIDGSAKIGFSTYLPVIG